MAPIFQEVLGHRPIFQLEIDDRPIFRIKTDDGLIFQLKMDEALKLQKPIFNQKVFGTQEDHAKEETDVEAVL